MSVPSVNIEDLKSQAKQFNYVRFTFVDINGIPRGRTINGRHVDRFLQNGLGIPNGLIAMGPNNEPPAVPEIDAKGFPNISYKPVISHIYELPWLSTNDGNRRTGEIICEPFLESDKVQESNPRCIARKQIEKLASMGLNLYSAYEMEFMLFEKETLKPVFSGNDFINVYTYSKFQNMFQEIEQRLSKIGVDVESFGCENSHGQFEFTFDPKYGIDSAEMMFKFKEAMKEICYQKDYHCTFMTTPFVFLKGNSNGAHFNFSLWNKDGKNALYDPDKPDNLSNTARHFIGGILKHIKALTAICSPTSNCYRRLHKLWAPDFVDWDIEHRYTSIRVKNQSENGTYFENRLPSGSSNPYLVLAATVTAGIDGIEQRLEPCKRGYGANNDKLPHTLEEALQCLDGDAYMKGALGEEFTRWFISGRKDVDIVKFRKHDMKSTNPGEIEAERLEYFEFM